MNYIKGGLKVFFGYCISLLMFGVFLYVFISITGDRFSFWLPFYSFLFFLMMFLIIYSDLNKLAMKEKRPQYNLNPYPLKGFIFGLIGFSPFILLELIYPLINLNDDVLERIKHLALNTLLGPLYWVLRIFGSTTGAYIAVSLLVPLIAMLGYLSGHYGFKLKGLFKKDTKPVLKK